MNDPKQTYDPDSYASRFLNRSIFPDDTRIFHRADCQYLTATRVTGARPESGVAILDLELSEGSRASLRVEQHAPGILRLTLASGGGEPLVGQGGRMLVLQPQGSGLGIEEEADAWVLRAEGAEIRVQKDPFSLSLIRGGREIFQLENESVAGGLITPPLGFRNGAGFEGSFLSWHIPNRRRFFGLGEKWNKVEKTSTRATVWACDTCGTNSNDMSYKSLPLLLCDAGWGLMLHSGFRSYWEVGSFNYTSGSLLVEEPRLDLFLYYGDSLKELIGLHTALTGRPGVPPTWTFGTWMSRCQYESRKQTDAVVERLRAEQIPCDVIHLDPLWMATHYYFKIGVDACDFVRNEKDFPDLERLYLDYAEKGFSTSLWVNPYLPEETPIYAEAAAAGYLLRDLGGGLARLEFKQPVGIVDFTNPAAKAWWKEKLKAELRAGAAVIKPDYGDRVPESALGHDGQTGRSLHNLYLHDYCETCFEAAREVHGTGIVWRRAGYIGTQRYPVTWAGDTQVSWEGLANCLRGGLSSGFGGEAFWASDIGGFCGPKTSPELYIRWMQFGMLSPMARFHGTTPREPWEFGALALENTRKYARLRYRLVPYLLELADEAARTGLPLMRHAALECPQEPNAHTLDDQYFLGSSLLVAPMIEPGETRRTVYFPAGRWVSLEDPGLVLEGGRFHTVEAPLDCIPAFGKMGETIPVFSEAPLHLKGRLPEIISYHFGVNADGLCQQDSAR